MKKLKYIIEYLFFLSIARLVNIFGLSNIRFIAKAIALFFFYIVPIRKKVVLKNLRIAFPNWDEKRIRNTAFQNYYSFAITFLEIMCLRYSNENEIKNIISVDSPIILKNFLERKCGLILLTAHFGNWELAAINMNWVLGAPIHVLSKKQKNIFVANWLKKMRERFGNIEIYIGMSVRELYSALKKNKVVGIVGDQRAPLNSLHVKFFNQNTPFFSGFANLAFKLKTPVIVAMSVRLADFKYKIFWEEIDYKNWDGNLEENTKKMLGKYITILEKFINQYPEQWFWMHNIWKNYR